MLEKRPDKEFEKKRAEVIVRLTKLEIEVGSALFRSACNRKLIVDRQKAQREAEIRKMERELTQLKSGKPLPQY
jgi:hypothetical protein